MSYTDEQISAIIKLARAKYGFKPKGLNDATAVIAIRRVLLVNKSDEMVVSSHEYVVTVNAQLYDRKEVVGRVGIAMFGLAILDSNGDIHGPSVSMSTWAKIDLTQPALVMLTARHNIEWNTLSLNESRHFVVNTDDELITLCQCDIVEIDKFVDILSSVAKMHLAGLV